MNACPILSEGNLSLVKVAEYHVIRWDFTLTIARKILVLPDHEQRPSFSVYGDIPLWERRVLSGAGTGGFVGRIFGGACFSGKKGSLLPKGSFKCGDS